MNFPTEKANYHLLLTTAILAVAGSVILILGNIIGSIVVPDHDWVADTVSDLAAGKFEIIQDVALYGYAGSLIACALGAANLHLDGTRWNIGIACLALLATCVIIIGARNEYGDQDNEGIVIHIYVVYVLGALFTALFVVMGRGLGKIASQYAVISYSCAAVWIVGAPVFLLMPTGYDGAFERGLGIVTVVWVMTFSYMLISVARITKSTSSPS